MKKHGKKEIIKDIDFKITTKDEALWTRVKESAERAIENAQTEIKINQKLIDAAIKELENFKSRDK